MELLGGDHRMISTTAFLDALTKLAQLSDEDCGRPWTWREGGPPLQVRDALYRSLEEELEAALSWQPAETRAARAVAEAQRAWGDLRGLLLGLPDSQLDRAPAPGEWSVREVLGHVLLVERRYRQQTAYAIARSDADPDRVQTPDSLLDGETSGGARAWVQRLDAERALGVTLDETSEAALGRPSVWAGYQIDVLFRLLRFAGHISEHTIQAEHALEASGWRPGEAARIVRRISAARGAHELFSPVGERERLDRVHAERSAILAA
jgi:hypothetical protein